jgi:hypothetical protein
MRDRARTVVPTRLCALLRLSCRFCCPVHSLCRPERIVFPYQLPLLAASSKDVEDPLSLISSAQSLLGVVGLRSATDETQPLFRLHKEKRGLA